VELLFLMFIQFSIPDFSISGMVTVVKDTMTALS